MIRHVRCVELNQTAGSLAQVFCCLQCSTGRGLFQCCTKSELEPTENHPKLCRSSPRHPGMGEVDDENFSKVSPFQSSWQWSKMGGKENLQYDRIFLSFRARGSFPLNLDERTKLFLCWGGLPKKSNVELPTFGGHVKWEKLLSLVGCDEIRELLPQEMSAKHAQDRHFCFCYFHGQVAVDFADFAVDFA